MDHGAFASPSRRPVSAVRSGGEKRERKRERERERERKRKRERKREKKESVSRCHLPPRKDVKDLLQTAICTRLKDNQTAQLKILVDTANAKGQLLLHTYAEAGLLDMCRLFVDEVATTRAAGHARSV